jgi:hypothetical protein
MNAWKQTSRASGAPSRPRAGGGGGGRPRCPRPRSAGPAAASHAIMAGHPAEHAQQDAMLRTMALGTLILNALSVRAAPGHFMRCRCSAIQNNVQTSTYDPRRPRATPSLLSCRPLSSHHHVPKPTLRNDPQRQFACQTLRRERDSIPFLRWRCVERSVEATRTNDMRSSVTCCVTVRSAKIANSYVGETKVLQFLKASLMQILRQL